MAVKTLNNESIEFGLNVKGIKVKFEFTGQVQSELALCRLRSLSTFIKRDDSHYIPEFGDIHISTALEVQLIKFLIFDAFGNSDQVYQMVDTLCNLV